MSDLATKYPYRTKNRGKNSIDFFHATVDPGTIMASERGRDRFTIDSEKELGK